MSQPLILTEKRGHVAILTLNRPDAMNALGAPGDGDQVAAACEAINDDQDIRCVILTGAGKAFSAGGDVKAMKAREGAFAGNGVAVRDGYRKNIHRIVRAIYGLEVPSIAAVNGAAIGLGRPLAFPYHPPLPPHPTKAPMAGVEATLEKRAQVFKGA